MKNYARKITLIYLIMGSLWMMITNNITLPDYVDFTAYHVYKGMFFITVTTPILYFLLHQTEIVTKRIVRNLKETIVQKSAIERQLRAERNILRTIIDNIPDYIYIKDVNNNQVLSNKSLWELVGASKEEDTLDQNLNQYLLPEMAAIFQDDDLRVIKNKEGVENSPHTFHQVSGEIQNLLVTKVPLFDEKGNCTGIVGISRDISKLQRKIDREQLVSKIIQKFGNSLKLEDGLQTTIAEIANTFDFKIAEAWLVDEHQTSLNLKAKHSKNNEEYFGNHRTRLPVGKGIIGHACEMGVIKVLRNIQDNPYLQQKEFAQAKNLNDAIVIPIKYKDEVVAVFIFLTSNFQDDEIEVNNLLEDISSQLGFHIDKKKNEIKLIEFNQQINAILENIHDGFISFNENWKITYWNKAAEVIFNISRETMVGRNLLDIVNEDDNYRFLKVYRQVFKSQKPAHFEQEIIARDLWLAISVYPTKDGLSVFFKDITDVKNLDTERRKRLSELNSKNAELEQFAYIASHDLQEPLRMVTSFLTQIERKYTDLLDEKGKQYIHFAVDGAVRMRKIILDLLEYSRTGKEAFKDESVDIEEIVSSIVNLNSTLFSEKNVVLRTENLPTIRAKKPLIRQLFQNIIINAIRYSKVDTTPEIVISCEEFPSKWQFSVTDNGIGIAPEYHQKIFVLFQRLHSERHIGGTGLGLAISKKIIETHEGEIWIDSQVDVGTTFYFTIKK